MIVKCVLEVGDTVKDKSDSIRFLVLCQSWIPGGRGGAIALSGSLTAPVTLISVIKIIINCHCHSWCCTAGCSVTNQFVTIYKAT